MNAAPISADELFAINKRIAALSLDDPSMRYDNPDQLPPSATRIDAIVSKVPVAEPIRQAAWIMRAIILLQPFADGNHRTALIASELVLERAHIRFLPTADHAQAFQEEVSHRRYVLLGGFEDAPLRVLEKGDDEVMQCCEDFIRKALDGGASSTV